MNDERMDYFRAIVATPLLALLSAIVAIPLLRRNSEPISRTSAAHTLFLLIGLVAENLLLLSFDEHAFGDEFGLYLYVMLPLLLLMGVVATLAVVRILRTPSSDAVVAVMSVTTLAFMAIGLFGAVSAIFPPMFPLIVHGYFAISAMLALAWFGYRRRVVASRTGTGGSM